MNPYRPEPTHEIHTGMDLFGNVRLVTTKKGQSERGELLRYFAMKTGKTIPHLCGRFIPPSLTLTDLYHLKSVADGYEREGRGPWSKAFFGALKARD